MLKDQWSIKMAQSQKINTSDQLVTCRNFSQLSLSSTSVRALVWNGFKRYNSRFSSLLRTTQLIYLIKDCFSSNFAQINIVDVKVSQKCGTLHDFACHPCAGAMLIFSVSFQFQYMYSVWNTEHSGLIILYILRLLYFCFLESRNANNLQSF